MLSIESVRGDNISDLAKLRPLPKEESELYETVKNDPGAFHKFIVSRTYFRKINQLCPPSVEKCYEIAPPLPVDLDHEYAVTFDEQVLYLQLKVAEGLSNEKK